MPNKHKKVTAPGDSDPQGPACDGDIVPVPSTSSSGEGRSGVLPTGTPVKNASAEEQQRRQDIWDAEQHHAETARKLAHILRAADDEEEHESWVCARDDLARCKTTELEASVSAVVARLATMAEASRRGAQYPRGKHPPHRLAELLALYCREMVDRKESAKRRKDRAEEELAALRKKNEVANVELTALREEVGRLRESGGGVRTTEPPPAERRDIGVQTPVFRSDVGGGADGWSPDRVRALIDERMGALCDNIVAEVCGGAVGRAPAREREVPPPPPRRGPPGPVPSSQDGVPWSRVVGRRERRKRKEEARPAPRPSRPDCGASRGGAVGEGMGEGRKPRLPKPPGTVAVVLAPVRGEQGVDVEGVADLVMGDEALADCGALDIRARRTVTGGLLLQIPGGEGGAAKADSLAEGIRGVLARRGVTGVRVDRPVKLADVRVTGLVGPVTPDKVARALAETGGCGAGEVSVGAVRRAPLGSGSAWVRMPVVAAHRVTAAGSVKVGWLSVGVAPIDSRPMRCYRCLCVGHAGQRCTAQEDRGGRCFRCGEPGHLARACAAPVVRCPLCADLGRRSDHRLGAATCAPSSGGGIGRGRSGGGGSGTSAPVPRPTAEGKGSGGGDSSPPQVDGGGSGVCPSAHGEEARKGRIEGEDPASSSVAEVDMLDVSPLPQRREREVKRGAGVKRPAEEEGDPGSLGVDARESGKKRGGVT